MKNGLFLIHHKLNINEKDLDFIQLSNNWLN